MADTITLTGGTTGTLDLTDPTKYILDGENQGANIDDEPVMLEIYATKPTGGRKAARRIKIGDDFQSPIQIMGASIGAAAANLAALRAKIDEAAAFDIDGAGTAVMLNIGFADETVVSRKVVGGHVKRGYKFLQAGIIDGVLVIALSDD
jgi:hypothetical protein